MNYKQIRIISAAANLIVICILILDSFLLPVRPDSHVVKEKFSESSSGYRTRSWKTYFVTDEAGRKIDVPYVSYMTLDPGEVFIIENTALFGKAVAIHLGPSMADERVRIGVINSVGFGIFIIFLIALLSLLVLIAPLLSITDVKAIRIMLVVSWISVVAIYFYFFNQA